MSSPERWSMLIRTLNSAILQADIPNSAADANLLVRLRYIP